MKNLLCNFLVRMLWCFQKNSKNIFSPENMKKHQKLLIMVGPQLFFYVLARLPKGTIPILCNHIFRIFGPPPPYVSMFLVMKIIKNWHFLTPPTSDYVIYEWSLRSHLWSNFWRIIILKKHKSETLNSHSLWTEWANFKHISFIMKLLTRHQNQMVTGYPIKTKKCLKSKWQTILIRKLDHSNCSK